MKRENGYYFVRATECTSFEVCHYVDGVWRCCGFPDDLSDNDFAEINETRLTPPAN